MYKVCVFVYIQLLFTVYCAIVSWQIPEYCKNVEESEIIAQSFPLIFAFDEIIALGYRENVNLAQIRTFTEMDSHEEKVFQAIRQVRGSLHRMFRIEPCLFFCYGLLILYVIFRYVCS